MIEKRVGMVLRDQLRRNYCMKTSNSDGPTKSVPESLEVGLFLWKSLDSFWRLPNADDYWDLFFFIRGEALRWFKNALALGSVQQVGESGKKIKFEMQHFSGWRNSFRQIIGCVEYMREFILGLRCPDFCRDEFLWTWAKATRHGFLDWGDKNEMPWATRLPIL